ncbi:hypothetical protein F5876DRAFT_84075 [Lentinula aff. lateritia]|uniref:Uncharacterized protein n=1 Tax=Lentinula aff. lateritia TaxID=2804960 RepID=A0ACC1TGT4_9AGAR|nr:hypothetical protein F5876DRAFT_84075 [Lentinula aff. lateritia]
MASSSSQTRSSAPTTLLPTSLLEAQVLLAGLQSKSTLPLFFESAVFQRLQQGDYSPPVIDSTNSPDYNGPSSLPAFSYPRSLVPFCFPPESLLPLSVASGLDLFCSAQMAIRTLQVLTDDSPSTEPPEVYEVFEEAAPFLIYIHDFWIGRDNCPLFAEHVLLTATSLSQGLPVFLRDNLEQQWGIPPDHRSQALDSSKFERFPAIPIPFWLHFREGSAMMRLVPPKELDPFASLHGQGVLPGAPKTILPLKASNVIPLPPATRTPVVPPRALRRNQEVESLKADASLFLSSPRSTRSKDSDNELFGGSPAIDITPQASSSSKVSAGRKGPKSPTTVKVVESSKASNPPSPATIYKRVRLPPRSRKIAPITSKGKSRQVNVSKDDPASNEVESEDEDEEDAAPPPKCLKTTSTISASLPRRSIKRVSVPKRVTKAAVRSVPTRSPDSTFQPVLLADAQGCLRLPEQSAGAFTPFPKFSHARNSAALNRESPLLAINPEFLELGSILETQNAHFTMQDLMQVNRVIRNPPQSGLRFGARSRGFGGKFCSTTRVQMPAMDALNALHTASNSSMHNLANSLRRASDLNDQLTQVGSLFDTTKELFLRSILDLQNAGEDPIVVLEALKAAEPNRRVINLNEWTLMATLFRWPSPFHLSGLDFDNRTPGEWIELLRSIHSGESTAHINKDGHLVESSPPPDSATEALEGLNEVEKGSVSSPCLGPPLRRSVLRRSTGYCNLFLIVLSRYTYPLVLVSPYCLLLYPAGPTRIAPSS